MEKETISTMAEDETPIANGPILILLVALLIAVLAGMYYWLTVMQANTAIAPSVISRPTAAENNEPESTTAEAQVEMMQAVSSSDEINAIEADLESTNLDSLDAELNAIDAEMETVQ